MKIVVTGAAGYLGSHLVTELQIAGFEVHGLDRLTPDPTPAYPFLGADLASPNAEAPVLTLLEGAACLVHCASIHPWKEYTDEQYLDANVKGTWKLYSLAACAGISKVVLTSSIAAGGYDIPAENWPVNEVQEHTLADIYSFTKHAQEDIARHFATVKGIQTLALRPPAFMPKTELQTGFELTGNFSVVSDIAGAHLAAVQVLCGQRRVEESPGPFEAIFTTNALPYTAVDAATIRGGDMHGVVRKYWPHSADWLISQGYESVWLIAAYDLSKAQRMLGWEPAYNFQQWFEEHGLSR